MSSLFIVLIGCYGITISIFSFGNRKLKVKNKKSDKINYIALSELSVIIPFRNESKSLPRLIKALNSQFTLPKELIFVNDHSDDESVSLITENLKIPFKIINLCDLQIGKKKAIRAGVESSSSKFVLTLDADVWFSPLYFRGLQKLPVHDLFILPVHMVGKGFLQRLYELDYALSNLMNRIVSGWKRPILASGANLLFNKEVFLKIDSITSHGNFLSGDDMFLLQDFIKNKQSILTVLDEEPTVFTAAPLSFKAFISQRLRWIGKSSKVNDKLGNLFISFILIVNGVFAIGTLVYIHEGNWNSLLLMMLFKLGSEYLISVRYFSKIDRIKTSFLVPLSSFFYPAYILTLVFLFPFMKRNNWKGRALEN